MTQFFNKLQLLLPAIVATIAVCGMLFTVSRVIISLLGEQVAASQDVVLRELTPNEIYRLYLFEQLNGNWKEYRLLSAVIKCESQWNEMAYNKKSNDFGLFQINYKTWNNKAIELGLKNYTDYWRDNLDLGIWIYINSGIRNWNWSKNCWNK